MNRTRTCLLVMAILLSGFSVSSARAGEGAPYLVLKSQSGNPQVPVIGQPYAYGWFGAQPRTQCGRSFGYYRNYTQWRQW